MDWTIFWQVPNGVASQSSFAFRHNRSLFWKEKAANLLLRSLYKFSIGLRWGDWLGHCIQVTFASLNHPDANLDAYGSYTFCKMSLFSMAVIVSFIQNNGPTLCKINIPTPLCFRLTVFLVYLQKRQKLFSSVCGPFLDEELFWLYAPVDYCSLIDADFSPTSAAIRR